MPDNRERRFFWVLAADDEYVPEVIRWQPAEMIINPGGPSWYLTGRYGAVEPVEVGPPIDVPLGLTPRR